jgi:hypothetical protein
MRRRHPTPLRFKLFVASALSVVVALAVGASAAQAADVTVGVGACAEAGGVTVPAGSTIIARFRDFEVNRGVATDYLEAQQTLLSVNGGPAIDISDSYGGPTQLPNGEWYVQALYPTGVTLANAGDSMTMTVVVSFSRVFAEEVNGPVGFSLGFSPGPPFITVPGQIYFTATCTVTAG